MAVPFRAVVQRLQHAAVLKWTGRHTSLIIEYYVYRIGCHKDKCEGSTLYVQHLDAQCFHLENGASVPLAVKMSGR